MQKLQTQFSAGYEFDEKSIKTKSLKFDQSLKNFFCFERKRRNELQ